MPGDVVRGHRFGSVHREADMAAGLVEAVGAADAFEPARGIVLGMAESDRIGHRPTRPQQPDHQQRKQQHHVEGEEERMIEAGDDKADRRLQHDGEAADHKAGHRFLHDREIEKAVRDAIKSGKLKGGEKLPAKMTLTIAGADLSFVIDGVIELE